MLIAHKIALDPTNAQATYFARACGTARVAYNWALAEWQRQYAACNLERLAASSAVSACGETRSGAERKPRVKRASKKQEPNSEAAA